MQYGLIKYRICMSSRTNEWKQKETTEQGWCVAVGYARPEDAEWADHEQARKAEEPNKCQRSIASNH